MLVTKAELNLRGHLTATSPHPFIFNLFNILSASPCMKWALSNKLLGLLLGVSLCSQCFCFGLAGKLVHRALWACFLSFQCTALFCCLAYKCSVYFIG